MAKNDLSLILHWCASIATYSIEGSHQCRLFQINFILASSLEVIYQFIWLSILRISIYHGKKISHSMLLYISQIFVSCSDGIFPIPDHWKHNGSTLIYLNQLTFEIKFLHTAEQLQAMVLSIPILCFVTQQHYFSQNFI